MPGAVVAGYSAFAAWGATSVTAAVVVGAVQGAVVGAVIGAGVAAVTGGDIGKGALYGAAAGGVMGGFAAGVSYAPVASTAGGGSGGATSTSVASAAAAPPTTATAPVTATTPNVAVNMPTSTMTVPEAQMMSLSADLAAAKSAQVTAGIGQGASQAVGQVGAGLIEERGAKKRSKKEIEAERTLATERFNRESERIAGRVPGQFKKQVANVEIPEWWNRHLIDERINGGLLNTNTASPITPIPVGV